MAIEWGKYRDKMGKGHTSDKIYFSFKAVKFSICHTYLTKRLAILTINYTKNHKTLWSKVGVYLVFFSYN